MEKIEAFHTAKVLVDPIVDQHGLEKYSHGAVFQTTSTWTPAEQHVDLTIRVAEWLREED